MYLGNEKGDGLCKICGQVEQWGENIQKENLANEDRVDDYEEDGDI